MAWILPTLFCWFLIDGILFYICTCFRQKKNSNILLCNYHNCVQGNTICFDHINIHTTKFHEIVIITVKGWQIFPKYSHYVRTLLMHWPVCVNMMVSSALAPNRCHGISNSPADSIMASYELPYAIRIMLQQLTLNVRGGPSYLGLTRSISWLLMPWLLTSPGHQQPWYWLCRICKPWSYLRKDFKYPCHINVE